MTTSRSFRWLARLALMCVVAALALTQMADLRAQTTFTFATLSGRPATGSSDGAGAVAAFNGPFALAVGANGVVYIADSSNNAIRRIGTDGVVTTLAGLAGMSGGTNGVGSAARFTFPRAIAADPTGSVYVLEGGNASIRKIAPDGTVSTLTNVFHELAAGLAADGNGNIYYSTGYAVWRMSGSGGNGTLVAGSVGNEAGYVNGSGGAARFNFVTALAIDGSGNLFVSDDYNRLVRKITPAGTVTTVGWLPYAVKGTPGVYGLTVDAQGTLYVANTVTHEIFRMTPEGAVSALAGTPGTPGSADGAGSAARFRSPRGVGISSTGVLYVADSGNSIIRTITPTGVVSTVAGVVGGLGNVDASGHTARFNAPRGIAVGPGGLVYVADHNNCTIRAVTQAGVTTTVAGTVAATPSQACGSGDGMGTAAKFSFPRGIAVDSTGNVFIADTGNGVIRKLTTAGTVTTFAGLAGSSGSADGAGADARFSVPQSVALDMQNNLYVADTGNHSIRVITPAGVVSTLAGSPGLAGSTDATGGAARFNAPRGVAVDTSGTVYVADSGNHSIRKIAAGGVVTTLAGTGPNFFDGQGLNAGFSSPTGIAVDASGTVFVADSGNNMVRRVTTAGVVTTVTMLNVFASYADGPAAVARFTSPSAVAFDAAGNLYVADTDNHAIRVGLVSPTAPAVTTHPVAATVNAGANTTFSVAVTGNLTPSIRWQVSTNSGTSWADLSDASPYSGTTTTTLTVISATPTLNGYRYRAVATNQSGSGTSDAATLTVNYMSATPTTLRFGASKAGAGGALTAVTPAQSVTVIFNGTSSTWTATSNQPWAVVTSGSGNGSGRFTVTIANPNNVLGASTSVTATITITPGTSLLAAVTVPVTLTVDLTGTSTQPPIGQMETPTQNATGVVGAIAVTGWVIDDVGIASVKVYRNCLTAAEPQNCQTNIIDGASLVYIGDGQVVAGARPDVEAGFPTYAATNTAGWGIQVLTNMLPRMTGTYAPNGGVGPLTLYAVATDIEGNRTLLSRAYTDTVRTPTSITMDNDNIAKPFGTIDTPAEGSTVSGSLANFGWAITPDSNTTADGTDILIPTNGTTMFVFIDGVPVSPVAYNQCRGTVGNPVPAGVYCNDDISNIFGNPTPQPTLQGRTANATRYRNLDAERAAIGAYIINTSGMASGLHSLAWSVTDSANRTEGIGSRYFYVLNSGDEALADPAVVAARAVQSRGAVSALSQMPAGTGMVFGRDGFDLSAPLRPIAADADGVRQVTIRALGRLELHLGDGTTGYLVAKGDLRDLPAGSRLDSSTGVFTWAPGPGFLGTYRLTFLGAGAQTIIDVTISADETPAGHSEIRMHVDTPADRQDVSSPFTIAGWALDPQAFTGSGIEAIHVWARRLDVPSTGAVFLGAAALGGQRPDVAAAFGEHGARAGYSLTATLPPGLHEVTVYAWNHRTARWEDARSVVVSVGR